MTLAGVIVDQGKDPSDYFSVYAPPLARLILRLGHRQHLPHAVLRRHHRADSAFACGLHVQARDSGALPALRPGAIDKIPLNAQHRRARRRKQHVRARVERFFPQARMAGAQARVRRRRNGRLRTSTIGRAAAFWSRTSASRSSRPARRVYWAKGFSGETPVIVPGKPSTVPHRDATLRLNGFAYKIQPIMTKSGMVYQPIDYVSYVTVTGKDGVPRNANDSREPSDRHRRIAVLPVELRLRAAVSGLARRHARRGAFRQDLCHRRLDRAAGNRARQLQVDQFVPTVDRQPGKPSADPRINNPAVALEASAKAGKPPARRSFRCTRGSTSATAGASRRSDT